MSGTQLASTETNNKNQVVISNYIKNGRILVQPDKRKRVVPSQTINKSVLDEYKLSSGGREKASNKNSRQPSVN